MTGFSRNYFENLKNAVLVSAGLSSIAPADCRMLELLILEKTRQRVSETTLKRIYGFAYSKFNPSMFTLNTLARFCDYEGWDDFSRKQETGAVKRGSVTVDWDLLKLNAGKITLFTLQALKNKTGIPYPQTISRQFINSHFAAFLQGNYTATVIAAPAGYGKTVALCHWVEEKLQESGDDIILFFSSNALMNVFLSGRDLNDWMLALLGYSMEEDIVALLDVKRHKQGNFYLIVDGVDEHMFKNEQFQVVLNQLVDIFSFYQLHNWFKLILTMRSATWTNYKHTIEMGESPWFEGFSYDNNKLQANVPLFSLQEIQELCIKINPAIKNFIALSVVENFNHPLYFQFYYKQHKKNFSLNDADHVSVYELISNFILNKVYMGQYSADKLYLMQAIVEEMDFKAGRFETSKLNVINIIKQYSQAYVDLLSIGFIREFNTSNDFEHKTTIAFSNNQFLEFSITKYLLLKNNNLFDENLINAVNGYFTGTHKLSILKWSVIYAIKSGQHESFQLLSLTRLSIKEKSDLIIFLGELLDKEFSTLTDTETLIQYFKQDCGEELFNYLFGLEFISADYTKTLDTLLKFELSDKKRIMVYTAQATLAIINLEINKLDLLIKNLGGFEAGNYYEFPVNPLHCLNAVYQYFKYGVINKDFFGELTHFYFAPPHELMDTTSNDLLFLLSAYVIKICGQPRKTLRLINSFIKFYKPVTYGYSVYNFFLKRIMIEDYLALGQVEKGLDVFNELNEVYNSDELFTQLIATSFNSIKTIAAFYNDQNKLISHITEDWVNTAINEIECKLVRVYLLAFLLKKLQCSALSSGSVYNYVNYIFLKTMSENSLRVDIFTSQVKADL